MNRICRLGAVLVWLGCGSNSLPASTGHGDDGPASGSGGSAAGTGGAGGSGGSGGSVDAGRDTAPVGVRFDAGVDRAPVGPDGGAPDAAPADAASVPDDGGAPVNTAGLCLPAGQEKLVVRIGAAGSPVLDVSTPVGLTCLSRYLPASGGDRASLDLTWTEETSGLFVVARSYDVTPGQTGAFAPYSLLISKTSASWIGAPDKCHVTVTSSAKIGEEALPGSTLVQDVHAVAGSVTCEAWAPENPGQPLQVFQFNTRVVLLR